MDISAAQPASGRVASLHLHPTEPGAPLLSAASVQLVAGKGIIGDNRYFNRPSKSKPGNSRRHVTLIAREEIAEHAVALGLQSIPPGAVRANIETLGVNLLSLLGQHVRIGTATLLFYEARTPCAKMDAVCAGLRESMKNQRQGILAQILQPGTIHIGDPILPV